MYLKKVLLKLFNSIFRENKQQDIPSFWIIQVNAIKMSILQTD